MRSRTLIDAQTGRLDPPSHEDTYERVRRTLDDALAELELEMELDDTVDRPQLH